MSGSHSVKFDPEKMLIISAYIGSASKEMVLENLTQVIEICDRYPDGSLTSIIDASRLENNLELLIRSGGNALLRKTMQRFKRVSIISSYSYLIRWARSIVKVPLTFPKNMQEALAELDATT